MNVYRTLSILLTVILASCSTGTLHASDPAVKLQRAGYLFDQQMRPFPAEQLLEEVLGQFQEENDQSGLAETYLIYGFFFRSKAVELSKSTYEKHGFLDGTPYSFRFDRSIEYFDKAKEIFRLRSDFPRIVHIEYNKALTFKIMGNPENACEAFNNSLASSELARENIPGYDPVFPEGFDTYAAFISVQKSRVPCEP